MKYFKVSQHYIAGILSYACINSLVQDCLGKERFIALVNKGWVSGWITVPLALLGFMLVCKLLKEE